MAAEAKRTTYVAKDIKFSKNILAKQQPSSAVADFECRDVIGLMMMASAGDDRSADAVDVMRDGANDWREGKSAKTKRPTTPQTLFVSRRCTDSTVETPRRLSTGDGDGAADGRKNQLVAGGGGPTLLRRRSAGRDSTTTTATMTTPRRRLRQRPHTPTKRPARPVARDNRRNVRRTLSRRRTNSLSASSR